MGQCTSAQTISINDHVIDRMTRPPEPKESFVAQKSKAILESNDDLCTTVASVADESVMHNNSQRNSESRVTEQQIVPVDHIENGKKDKSIHLIDQTENKNLKNDYNLSWRQRRNSNKEKLKFVNNKVDEAKAELRRRLSVKSSYNSKCPRCGDLGPEKSNQYYTFYLIVPSVTCKTKCRRCNIYFSFEYIGFVKSFDQAVCFILDEDN